MPGPKIFTLGNSEFTVGGMSSAIDNLTTLGVSIINNSASSDNLLLTSGMSILFDTGICQSVAISADGRLGIGTRNPRSFVHIHQPTEFNNATGGIIFETPTSGNTWNVGINSGNDLVFVYNGVNTGFFADDGTNVQVNFTGQHRCLAKKNITKEDFGLIVRTTGKYINENNEIKATINESLPYVEMCNAERDKSVFGVISEEEARGTSRNYPWGMLVTTVEKTNINEMRYSVNSLGEGGIWVCNKNGAFQNGDYMTSSTVRGYGVKQDDDLLHNYTVAKITEDCNFSLTKISKQKLKVFLTGGGQILTYDIDGNPDYENDLDEQEDVQMTFEHDTRFLNANGGIIRRSVYNTRLSEGGTVYIACFVGCTYHCG